jgi:hypothetical protein
MENQLMEFYAKQIVDAGYRFHKELSGERSLLRISVSESHWKTILNVISIFSSRFYNYIPVSGTFPR